MKNLSVTEQLMYATTRVECAYRDGKQSMATAFFFKFHVDGDHYYDAIVSNRHVFENLSEISFHITAANGEGDPTNDRQDYHVKINDPSTIVILHPDPNVDLAIMLIRHILIGMYNQTQKPLFYRSINVNQIADLSDEKFDALEEVLMVGYPNGLWDEVNNRPIFRRGVTATDPKVNYQGLPMFLIDCACIQGSSGSPIVSVHKGLVIDKHGKPLRITGETFELLGIQCAMPIKKQMANIEVVNVPTAKKIYADVTIPINLGYIIKAEKLKDFIPILRARMETLNDLIRNLAK